MVSGQDTMTADIAAESFAKGQPRAGRIRLALFRNQMLKRVQRHASCIDEL